MATVRYDDGSFFLDDQRIWLVSGEVAYFRVPPEHWRDRLVKARRAGLNCISTPVAWNVHEPSEGRWQVDGQADVAAFVRLAGELGLYVILQPGPYIGAAWDFGGFPPWLAAKSGTALRSNNAAYQHYFDKYFRQVLPRLAEQQATRGGPIILVQAESHYTNTTMPERLGYLEFVNQLLRRSGFDVPIITCNELSEPPVPEAIETAAGWDHVVARLKRLRSLQAGMPLMVTELTCGGPDVWGGAHTPLAPVDIARRAMEVLGCGAQYNYAPWHGGTNFGFHGARDGQTPTSYLTTSYDAGAPLAEGGGLTETYYLTRLVNLLANHMGRFLATCYVQEPRTTVHDSTATFDLIGSLGRWAFFTNNGAEDIDQIDISLPEGQELTVPLGALGAAAVPIGLQLTDELRLDYANLTPLGFFKDSMLVLHGPAGWNGCVSINGVSYAQDVPDGDEPAVIELENLRIVLINTDLAMRTWVTDEALYMGPAFVGEDPAEDVVTAHGTTQYCIVSFEDGKVSQKKDPSRVRPPTAPRLGQWQSAGVCGEVDDDSLEWHKIDRPRDVDHLGVHEGYIWYRVDVNLPRQRKFNLYLPQCRDRALVHLNGRRIGTWGPFDGETCQPISAGMKRGANVLTLLVDNLGRAWRHGVMEESKGLSGHVYDARPLKIGTFKVKQVETFPKRIIPRQLADMIDSLSEGPIWEATVSIQLSKVTPIHLTYRDLPHHVAIFCNERTAAFHPYEGEGFGDVVLGSELKKGRNVLKLLLWGDVDPACLENVVLHSLLEPITQAGKVSWRAWEMPNETMNRTGSSRPAWYETTFKCKASSDQPLFLSIAGAHKGQIFINGHNAGRFWSAGPQERYYLPDGWLQESNQLLVFSEDGHKPSRCKLEYCPHGPYAI